jgi:hypothetical protein
MRMESKGKLMKKNYDEDLDDDLGKKSKGKTSY